MKKTVINGEVFLRRRFSSFDVHTLLCDVYGPNFYDYVDKDNFSIIHYIINEGFDLLPSLYSQNGTTLPNYQWFTSTWVHENDIDANNVPDQKLIHTTALCYNFKNNTCKLFEDGGLRYTIFNINDINLEGKVSVKYCTGMPMFHHIVYFDRSSFLSKQYLSNYFCMQYNIDISKYTPKCADINELNSALKNLKRNMFTDITFRYCKYTDIGNLSLDYEGENFVEIPFEMCINGKKSIDNLLTIEWSYKDKTYLLINNFKIKFKDTVIFDKNDFVETTNDLHNIVYYVLNYLLEDHQKPIKNIQYIDKNSLL